MCGGSLHGPIRLEASHHRDPPGVGDRDPPFFVFGQEAIGAKRNGHVKPVSDLNAEKRWRRDADHRERTSVQGNGTSQSAGVASELTLPERITEHGARAVAYLAIVLRGESAPQYRGDTEVTEKLAADVQALGVPGFSSRGKVKARRAPG